MKMSFNCPCFLLQLAFLECFMSILSSLMASFLFLSLQSTSFESSLLFTPYELEIESVQARSCVNGRSRACLFSFPICSMYASSWRRDSILRPSERMLCILPQDHGVLAPKWWLQFLKCDHIWDSFLTVLDWSSDLHKLHDNPLCILFFSFFFNVGSP